tara:strand:- start:26 stop:397 length:372 start_codon:yes stop_codon:yes gene_type:complete
LTEILFVSLGAILGANTRFLISNKLEKMNLNKKYSTLIINTSASFCLGLFLSLIDQLSSFKYYYALVLFFSIGFLGSFSTFSAFVYDLFDLCSRIKFSRALNLFLISSFLGIIAFALGFLLGN